MNELSYECCILGAGPAGFGAAMELASHGVTDLVMVDRNSVVGGLSRTEEFGGARFDVGPHRFFTNNREVDKLWHDTLGPDFRPVQRLTRIYYGGKLFNYPIKALDVFSKLGPLKSTTAVASFALSAFSRSGDAATFEDWGVGKFGRNLYEAFFKTYTEKVWGIPCSEIGAEWAAQRIKGLDLVQVLRNSLPVGRQGNIKTLVEEFDYPVRGAGQMYEAMADQLSAQGMTLMLDTTVVRYETSAGAISSVVVRDRDGAERRIRAGHVFNSVPITQFFRLVEPAPDEQTLDDAGSLYYREHITVNLLVNGTSLFPDQWIYIHSPEVKMARLANYNNFSKNMSGSEDITALSIEYFTFQNEPLWQMRDAELMELAAEEITSMGLVERGTVEGAWVVRETESYPTYYIGFQEPYDRLRAALDGFTNLSPIGRGGMYKYNNQDHSTMSGILAARNYLGTPGTPYNVWDLNIDAEYQEAAARPAG